MAGRSQFDPQCIGLPIEVLGRRTRVHLGETHLRHVSEGNEMHVGMGHFFAHHQYPNFYGPVEGIEGTADRLGYPPQPSAGFR